MSLVLEALHERGLMRQNAPHLVSDLPFIVPNYEWWEAPFYGVGLKLYDMLAGKLGFGKSRHLSLEETVEHIPELERDGLRGGTLYYDGQFDDARLAIDMARTAAGLGATLINLLRRHRSGSRGRRWRPGQGGRAGGFRDRPGDDRRSQGGDQRKPVLSLIRCAALTTPRPRR